MKPSADAGGSVAFEVEDLDPLAERAVILDSEGNPIILRELKKG